MHYSISTKIQPKKTGTFRHEDQRYHTPGRRIQMMIRISIFVHLDPILMNIFRFDPLKQSKSIY